MNQSNSPLSPNTSPVGNSNASGVRRVNNRPMYILFGLFAAFLIVIAYVANQRASIDYTTVDTSSVEQVGDATMYAEQIAGITASGYVPPAPAVVNPDEPPRKEKVDEDNSALESTPNLSDEAFSDIPVVRPDYGSAMPPQSPTDVSTSLEDDDAERIRMAKLQMLEEAIRAGTKVQAVAPRSSSYSPSATALSANGMSTQQQLSAEITRVREQAAANRASDPTAAYKERMAQLEDQKRSGITSSGIGTLAGNLSNESASTPNNRDDISLLNTQTATSSVEDRWALNEPVQVPRSPYELRAGFVIPATLISGINSDLPGQIIAQVSQNVSDTATGRYLLIPQGSRLVGSYSNDVAYGQKRVMVAWQRIVFPDGKALDIGSMPGSDSAGYSGFKDQVDNHYLRIFGSAFLMSGISAGVTLSQNSDDDDDDNQRARDVLSETFGRELGQVAIEMIRKNMSVSPTLQIRPGYRFNVVVMKDMTFSKPYHSFDY